MVRVLKLVALAIGVGLATLLGLSWQLYQHWQVSPLPLDEDSTTISVATGESVSQLANRLLKDGVLDHAADLVWLARLRGMTGQVRAGEYVISRGATPASLLETLVSGAVKQHALTIIEGMSFRQVMNLVDSHAALTKTLENSSGEAVMEALGYPGQHPEGRFSPDTYHFPRGLTDVEFLRRAYDMQAEILRQEWETRADELPLKDMQEALVLASIIEKETSLESERAQIAGVFVRRLIKNMRLQTDPTVIYGLGESFDGDIRSADLRRDTPYNTYTRHGLPPTPIAMPGRASIHAAVHPAEGDELYFVATGDGGHHFSATLEEHNEAVRRYQLKR